jgi:hypothetical protein
MCLIAGRTHDNPQLFHDCVVKFAAKFIYLEKPGAPTVDALQDMQKYLQISMTPRFLLATIRMSHPIFKKQLLWRVQQETPTSFSVTTIATPKQTYRKSFRATQKVC